MSEATPRASRQVFINCLVENPAFDSQTKENMTLKQSSFGSKCAPGRLRLPENAQRSPQRFWWEAVHPWRQDTCTGWALHHTRAADPHGAPPVVCSAGDKFFKDTLNCGVLEAILSFAQTKQNKVCSNPCACGWSLEA